MGLAIPVPEGGGGVKPRSGAVRRYHANEGAVEPGEQNITCARLACWSMGRTTIYGIRCCST